MNLSCSVVLSLLNQSIHRFRLGHHLRHFVVGRVLINNDFLSGAVRLLRHDDLDYVVFVNVELNFNLLTALLATGDILDPNGADFIVL